jgi:hypothetical protein
MAGNTDTIKEFLVKLGFNVDQSGQKKFIDGVIGATLKVAELGVAVKTASAAVVASVTVIASQMEALYFASQRTGAAVANIQALGFAAAQMGSTAEAAKGSLENLARFMRNSPGANGLIQSLGVQTQGANGQLRDTAEILQDLGKQFSNMPYYRANAYAQALGIDEKTLMALRQGMGQFGDDYRDMLAKAGLDSQQAAASSHEFMVQIRTLGSAFVILSQKVATSLTGKMSGDIKRFREGIVDNFGRIAEIVEKIAKGILFLADIISTLGLRAMQIVGGIIDWFNSLDDGTKKLIEGVGGLLIAWKLLNAGFLATPLGQLVLLGTTILALYDDFKVWKEGGKSLIDWSRWLPDIELAQRLLHAMGEQFTELGEIIHAVMDKRWADLGTHAARFAKLALGGWKDVYNTIKGQIEGAPVPAPSGSPSSGAPGGTSSSSIANSGFGALIARGEGDYDSVNLGSKHGYRSGKENLSGMTVSQVMESQRTGQFNAAGRYQLIGSTLSDAVKALGLKGDEKFDKGTQDRIFEQYLVNNKRRAIGDFIAGRSNDIRAAIKAASLEWASVADPSTGKSHYAGVANNTASISPDDMARALQTSRAAATGNPYAPEQLASASKAGMALDPGESVVSVNANTTINVTGSGDPHATAQAVAHAQSGVNQRLVRNMRTAAQ